MSVKQTHSEYDEMLPQWEKCSDVMAGTRAVREKGKLYLPMLTDEENDDYQKRVNRTTLYNASYRTLVGFLGMLFRKPPVFHTESAKLLEMAKDITLSGVSLNIFALELCEECLTTGRVGLWVNYPVVSDTLTLADANSMGARPSLNKIEAENIINWKTMRVGNEQVLQMVVMTECQLTPIDEFSNKEEKVYRVLDLVWVPDLTQYVYRVRLFKVNDKNEDVLIDGPFFPKMGGKFMSRLPFTFVSPDDTRPDCDEPPFIDLVDMNLAHYQVTADYEHGCHWSGIPSIYITGHTLDEKAKIKVGGASALVFPSATTKVGLIEVGTAGFSALEKNLDRKESQMVILGARLLEVAKPGIEAAETAMIHRAGEQSILASMAGAISEGLSQALRTFAEWAGENPDISYEINREFFNTPMTHQMLKEIVAAWQSGAISAETKFEALKKGEMYTPGIKFEEEQVKIDANKPPTQTNNGVIPNDTVN